MDTALFVSYFRDHILQKLSILVDCAWSDWGECSKTCGNGTRNRIIKIEAKYGGKQCEGVSSKSCRTVPCPGKISVERV